MCMPYLVVSPFLRDLININAIRLIKVNTVVFILTYSYAYSTYIIYTVPDC